MTTFRTYLKIFLSHRVYIAIYLVMLSLVGVVIGLSAYSGTTGEFQVATANVAVIDRDGSELSAALAQHVLQGNNQVQVADEKRSIQDAVARDQVSYLLVIPGGWGEGLLDAARQGTQAPENQFAGIGKSIQNIDLIGGKGIAAVATAELARLMPEDEEPEDIEDETTRFRLQLGIELEGDTVKKIRVRIGDRQEEVYVISLIEHKSGVDADVAMQPKQPEVIWSLSMTVQQGISRSLYWM